MLEHTVYLGMGANLGDPLLTLCRAAEAITKLPDIGNIRFSHLYKTSPVNATPPDFLNAVCCFSTNLDPSTLQRQIEKIERELGKVPKSKDAPRYIDLDLLFYGTLTLTTERLTVPHPRWKERLFVLYPLRDLTEKIVLAGGEMIDLEALIAQHEHKNEQQIEIYAENIDVKKESGCKKFPYWPWRAPNDYHRSLRH